MCSEILELFVDAWDQGASFYLRQPWLYVEGFHLEQRRKVKVKGEWQYINKPFRGQKTFYIWLETDGHRGSIEIGSLLNLHAQKLRRMYPQLELYHSVSDGCGGQNKSRYIVAVMWLISQTYNITWHHAFMESGHSYMSCDTDFGHVSQKLKGKMEVFHLEEYVSLFKDAVSNCDVVRVDRAQFLDCKKVAGMTSIKARNTENEEVCLYLI